MTTLNDKDISFLLVRGSRITIVLTLQGLHAVNRRNHKAGLQESAGGIGRGTYQTGKLYEKMVAFDGKAKEPQARCCPIYSNLKSEEKAGTSRIIRLTHEEDEGRQTGSR